MSHAEIHSISIHRAQAAAEGFVPYTESVKSLNTHVSELKKVSQEAFSKAGLVGQALVELTEVEGGELAIRATKVRSTIARIQQALLHRMIPELDKVLLNELADQQLQFKSVKDRMASRLEAVADANHYKAKHAQLVTGLDKNPEGTQRYCAASLSCSATSFRFMVGDKEKVQRNKDKSDAAVAKLDEETRVLIESLKNVDSRRVGLCSERCAWMRALLKSFFEEAVRVSPSFSRLY